MRVYVSLLFVHFLLHALLPEHILEHLVDLIQCDPAIGIGIIHLEYQIIC